MRKAYREDRFPKPVVPPVKVPRTSRSEKLPVVLITDVPEERETDWGEHQQEEQS